MEQPFEVFSVTAFAKMRRPDRILNHSVNEPAPECVPNLGSVDTPARDDSYADDTHAQFMRPVLRSAPHDKLTSNGILCNGLRAFATRFSICLSPLGNGSSVSTSTGSEKR